MSLCFRQAYFDDPAPKAEFLRFLQDIHGLDLGPWDRAGLWDPCYVPFSFFEGDRLVSNVCVYSLPMVVAGEECRVAQLSSVGTAPTHRRRGLNRELTTAARTWCREQDHRFLFLFADREAVPYYTRLGFRAQPQWRFRCPAPSATGPDRRSPLVPLDPTHPDTLDFLAGIVERRTSVSRTLGHRSTALFLFHALYSLRDCLYHLPELDVVVAARAEAETLVLHDVVGPHLPSLATLHPHLPNEGITSYEFGFCPDLLEVEGEVRSEHDDGEDGTHVDGPFPFPDSPFRFPSTAHA